MSLADAHFYTTLARPDFTGTDDKQQYENSREGPKTRLDYSADEGVPERRRERLRIAGVESDKNRHKAYKEHIAENPDGDCFPRQHKAFLAGNPLQIRFHQPKKENDARNGEKKRRYFQCPDQHRN